MATPFNGLKRRVERLLVVYRDAGLYDVLMRVSRRFRARGPEDPAHAGWLHYKKIWDAEFDGAYGTDTGGIDEIFDLTIVGPNSRHGLSHIATMPAEFKGMMEAVALDVKAFTFVDLGCGKGRAILLAAQYPFKKIIGVEFARELVATAEQNIAHASSVIELASRVELLHADAATFQFPAVPLVIYLYNPFGSEIIKTVARNARDSWIIQPRAMEVLYINPIHLNDFIDEGWHVAQTGASWCRLQCSQIHTKVSDL